MQNVISIWNGLDMRRRIVMIGATLAVFLAVLGLARLSGSPQMELLYAGLDGRSAGEVVRALDQQAVSYEVRGDSIYVAAGSRDALRMGLAGEGLPAAGGAGYELLDSLSGFGTTSQMFDAAYWRAKEGELARTILAVPGIRNARVHIAQGPSDPFRRDQRPTASVTITTASGQSGTDQARALRHLVASAVAGMRPEDVQIIDTVSGLIAGPDETESGTTGATRRAEEIRSSVERLLAARVGPGRAVVEVSVDLITEREQITERTFDPQSRVAISSDTEENSQTSTAPGGAVTVASNLPEGDAEAGGQGRSQSSNTRERLNYEVSETQRELMRSPGGIRRMSVAVLVDGQMTAAADAAPTWTPRSDEELTALRELVASAVGLDETRGDVLTLKSMEFVPPLLAGTEATEARLLPAFGPVDTMAALRIGALAAVALILGLFVLRPLLTARRSAALSDNPAASGPPLALPGGQSYRGQTPAALTGEIDTGFAMPGTLPSIDFAAMDKPPEDPADRLRRLITQRQSESLEILRGWLEPGEDRG